MSYCQPMPETFKAIVLAIKQMNHFVIREYKTPNANQFLYFEKELFETYSTRRANPKTNFKTGIFVAVCVPFDDDRCAKRWLRGVIRENYKQKGQAFVVYFGDYGFEMICIKPDMHLLDLIHTPKYFPFQRINFFLTDVDHKIGVKRDDVIKEIKSNLEKREFIITVTVEGMDKKKAIYGSISLEKDCDLAALLLEKQLVEDVHYCCRPKKSKNELETHVARPKNTGPFRSAIKAGRVHYDIVCKCDEIVKYKRKLMRDLLKDKINVTAAEDNNHKLTNSI